MGLGLKTIEFLWISFHSFLVQAFVFLQTKGEFGEHKGLRKFNERYSGKERVAINLLPESRSIILKCFKRRCNLIDVWGQPRHYLQIRLINQKVDLLTPKIYRVFVGVWCLEIKLLGTLSASVSWKAYTDSLWRSKSTYSETQRKQAGTLRRWIKGS